MLAPRSLIASTLTLILAATALAGCVAASNDGHVSFFVKDAPIDDLSSVYVTFSKVTIHQEKSGVDKQKDKEKNETGDDNETDERGGDHEHDNETDDHRDGRAKDGPERFESDGRDDDPDGMDHGVWITVINSTHTIDLKHFSGNSSALLGGLDVPPGTYNQIRIYVDSAYGIKNGTRVNITVPSGVLKITHRFTVVAGQAAVFTLDFDLAHSLVKTGDGGYILRPHIRLEMEHKERHHAQDDEKEHRQREEAERKARRGEGQDD